MLKRDIVIPGVLKHLIGSQLKRDSMALMAVICGGAKRYV
jgi:hypothetical protein